MKQEANIVDAEIVGETTDKHEKSVATSLKTRLLSSEHWLRFMFMVLFAIIAGVAAYVLFILVIVQFLFVLVTGDDHERLRGFGHSLAVFFAQIIRFLTYNSHHKPFPFSDWPTADDK
jgi:hypothetical protein